jgi:hypothetical protein
MYYTCNDIDHYLVNTYNNYKFRLSIFLPKRDLRDTKIMLKEINEREKV